MFIYFRVTFFKKKLTHDCNVLLLKVTLPNTARHPLPTQQCQTNILFVQRQQFVYENITTIKQSNTKKRKKKTKNKKYNSAIFQFSEALLLLRLVCVVYSQGQFSGGSIWSSCSKPGPSASLSGLFSLSTSVQWICR